MPTPRQAEYVAAALDLQTTSPAKVARALGVSRPAAHQALTRMNAAGELAKQQERQRDKAQGLVRIGRKLVSSLEHEDFSTYDGAQKVLLLRQLVEILPKQQECGLIEDVDSAPAAVRQRVEMRRLHSLEVGARVARRYGLDRMLELVKARRQRIMASQ